MHKMFYLSLAFQIYGMRIISGCISKSVWHTERTWHCLWARILSLIILQGTRLERTP